MGESEDKAAKKDFVAATGFTTAGEACNRA
jgi:hypothetical protein